MDPFGGMDMGYEQAVPKESFDIKADLNVSFEEAFEGCNKKFSVRVPGRPKADSISLKIPEGCPEGAKLRLKGQGKPNPSAHKLAKFADAHPQVPPQH